MSSRSLNKVQLIGNITRDPEMRYTGNGTAVCTIGLATNRSWTSESGEKNEETEFHRLVAWSKLAEICGQLLKKGRKIYAEGRLQTREWTTQDGQKRQTTEIVLDNMIMLDGPRGDNAAPADASQYAYPQDGEAHAAPAAAPAEEAEAKPAKAGKKSKAKTAEDTGVTAVEDVSDDIPF